MIFRELEKSHQYAEAAEAHTGVFGSAAWLKIYEKDLRCVGIYKDEKQLVGGFFYIETKKYGLRFIKLPPYTPHCGLFFNYEAKNKSSLNNFSKEIISGMCDYISSRKAALTILAFPSTIVDLQPFIWNKYKVVPNYTYRIDLAQSMSAIISNFDSKHRNAINRAVKENVEVQVNALKAEELYRFFSHSLKAAGANVYHKELGAIFSGFAEPGNSFSLAAKKDNRLLGAIFCIYDKRCCYYLLGGVIKENGVQGVNNLLVQKGIERARELGCEVFDFEGSMLKGVEKFFRGFGPGLEPYFTINKASLPLEMALKFKKRELF